MKVNEAIVNSINIGFKNCVFMSRDEECVKNTLNVLVKGSDNVHFVPCVPEIKVEKIDDLHDKLSLLYDDYKVEGVVTWRESKEHYVFESYAT